MLSLVTGATGLIGSHLVEALLLRGEQVRAFVRPTSNLKPLRDLGVDVRIGNLRDNAALMSAAQGVNRIFHCAALVADWGDPAAFQEANVLGVRNVLAAATRVKVAKFVHLSTSDVYGFPGRPVEEPEKPSPRGYSYSDSKIEGEALVAHHHKTVGLPACILRPATVYGPRARLLVSGIVEAIRRRRMVFIDEGHHGAGLTYVGNVVDALILAGDDPASVGQVYNISDGSDVTWRQYLDALSAICQVPPIAKSYPRNRAMTLATLYEGWYRLRGRTERPPLTRLSVELMGTDQSISIAKAQRELGYHPRVTFEEGMRHVRDWLLQTGVLGDGFFA